MVAFHNPLFRFFAVEWVSVSVALFRVSLESLSVSVSGRFAFRWEHLINVFLHALPVGCILLVFHEWIQEHVATPLPFSDGRCVVPPSLLVNLNLNVFCFFQLYAINLFLVFQSTLQLGFIRFNLHSLVFNR